ncbi:MAG: hypothetical protein LBM25_01600 [Bacteroidales bacterium]|jgi:2'-5' RNA ligase|nr:hypothetical protein [Bacteroidales bacterium]
MAKQNILSLNINSFPIERQADYDEKRVILLGIKSNSYMSYMVFCINKMLLKKFKIIKDFEKTNIKTNELTFFKTYYYEDTFLREHHLIIKNKNSDNEILIPFLKDFKYLYVLLKNDRMEEYDKVVDEILQTIKTISDIVEIRHVDFNKHIYEKPKKKKVFKDINTLFGDDYSLEKLDNFQQEEEKNEEISDKDIKKIEKNKGILYSFYQDVYSFLDTFSCEKKIFLAYITKIPPLFEERINSIFDSYIYMHLQKIPCINYHLTLQYIGEKSYLQIHKIKLIIKEILLEDFKEDIEVEVENIEIKEHNKNNVLLWMMIKENDIIKNTKQHIKEVFKQEKISAPFTVFPPHITIAKVKKNDNINSLLRELDFFIGKKITIKSPILFESITIDNDLQYEIIETF